jgi:hypothetical protein
MATNRHRGAFVAPSDYAKSCMLLAVLLFAKHLLCAFLAATTCMLHLFVANLPIEVGSPPWVVIHGLLILFEMSSILTTIKFLFASPKRKRKLS